MWRGLQIRWAAGPRASSWDATKAKALAVPPPPLVGLSRFLSRPPARRAAVAAPATAMPSGVYNPIPSECTAALWAAVLRLPLLLRSQGWRRDSSRSRSPRATTHPQTHPPTHTRPPTHPHTHPLIPPAPSPRGPGGGGRVHPGLRQGAAAGLRDAAVARSAPLLGEGLQQPEQVGVRG